MFVRNGQKLGSVLVEQMGTEPEPEPKPKETPKKQMSAKKQTSTKQTASEPSASWNLTEKSAEADEEKGEADA